MNEGDIFDAEFESEVCCERCGDIMWYSFYCPVCEKRSKTYENDLYDRSTATCRGCASAFEIQAEDTFPYWSECKVKLIFKGKKKEKV
jgi:hypothetical protein